MTTDKPSRNEDEYFAKQNAELLEATRARAAEAAAAAERQSHFMKCPKSGHDLVTTTIEDTQIDTCPVCGGIWLDAGELDQLTHREDPGVFRKILGDVAAALRAKRS